MFTTCPIRNKGIGIVTSKEISQGTFVGVYLKRGIELVKDCKYIFNGWAETYPLGRYLNHSYSPNLSFEVTNCEIKLYSNIDIAKEVELTVDYIKLKDLLFLPDSIIKQSNVDNFIESSFLTQSRLNKTLI